MSWRNIPFVQETMLVAATFLLIVHPVLAGPAAHEGGNERFEPRPYSQAQPFVRVVRVPVIVGVVVTMAPQPAKEQLRVNLRGPDGQVRRFPVEGGRDAIQYRQIVLRPGQTLTIRWVAAK